MIKYILIALLALGVIGGIVYKAMHPADYKHPLHR